MFEFRNPGGSPVPVLQVLVGESFDDKGSTCDILLVNKQTAEQLM